jgi:hypothetical protein
MKKEYEKTLVTQFAGGIDVVIDYLWGEREDRDRCYR